jgi:hypothetical protein
MSRPVPRKSPRLMFDPETVVTKVGLCGFMSPGRGANWDTVPPLKGHSYFARLLSISVASRALKVENSFWAKSERFVAA